jgi:hypothetical protein
LKRSFGKFVLRLQDIGLAGKVEARARRAHVSLRDLYEGPGRAPSINAARRDVYIWLFTQGKGNNEIARLFDRAPSGVLKLIREKESQK